jgi:hypothetical protein
MRHILSRAAHVVNIAYVIALVSIVSDVNLPCDGLPCNHGMYAGGPKTAQCTYQEYHVDLLAHSLDMSSLLTGAAHMNCSHDTAIGQA